jgi:SAM-dependent methyltransferase
VQTEDFSQAHELFAPDYAYFSAFSSSWLAHCERYVSDMVTRFELGAQSHVVEIAANDGYLLQYVQARNIPCTGVEPTAGTAAAARARGIRIVEDFFGTRLARDLAAQGKQADLTTANNVLAHVPDINDFVAGFALLLKPQGVATFEFPHLLRLITENQFDTIYHEHFSYLSLTAVNRIFTANGLTLFDVEEHPTHGGSLRVFARRSDTGGRPRSASVDELLKRECLAGMTASHYYAGFQARADKVKNDFLSFLLDAKSEGKSVAAYGAAAKGNTLMNYAGIRPDLIAFVVDRNPAKQGKYMPGSRIPIVDESRVRDEKPDYVVILPWNLKAEVTKQLEYIKSWGGTFATAVPQMGMA